MGFDMLNCFSLLALSHLEPVRQRVEPLNSRCEVSRRICLAEHNGEKKRCSRDDERGLFSLLSCLFPFFSGEWEGVKRVRSTTSRGKKERETTSLFLFSLIAASCVNLSLSLFQPEARAHAPFLRLRQPKERQNPGCAMLGASAVRGSVTAIPAPASSRAVRRAALAHAAALRLRVAPDMRRASRTLGSVSSKQGREKEKEITGEIKTTTTTTTASTSKKANQLPPYCLRAFLVSLPLDIFRRWIERVGERLL